MTRYDIDLHVDLTQAILWQYNNADNLVSIVNYMQSLYDEANVEFWQKWYDDVYNVETANDFGLEVWARILNLDAGISFEPQPDKMAFGFSRERKNFQTESNFGARDGGYVGFTTEQKRLLIKARIFELTQSPTLSNINRWLKENLWKGDSKVYVADPQDMSFAIYTFGYQPDANLLFLMDNADFLPRPSTVNTQYRIIGKQSFGVSRERRNFAKPSNFGVL